jgi:hypothetical protein
VKKSPKFDDDDDDDGKRKLVEVSRFFLEF